jgi:NAD(P)-dependent dehydrogenase (short-subunit alcohol dehydrogenase family)
MPGPAVDELRRFRLDERVAIVTGGTGGIGGRLCEAFARVGARVVVHGRDRARAEGVAERLREEGAEALASIADVTRKEDADRLVDEAMAAYGRVDVIVNTVGGGAGTALHAAESYPEAEWDRILDLNLRAALLPTQAAARAMIAGGRGGRVLHYSSVRGAKKSWARE